MNDGFLFDEMRPLTPKMWDHLARRAGVPMVPTTKGHTLYYCSTCHAMVAVEQAGKIDCACGARYFRPVRSRQWSLSEFDLDLLENFNIDPE